MKQITFRIRQETAADHSKVYELIQEAFASADHSDGNEQDLVVALRKSSAFLPKLSLVAVAREEIVGHILFTKAKVGADEVLALAPLSVKPDYQRKCVGTALIQEGHRIAAMLGYSYSLVLGSPKYYPRFGYVPAGNFGVLVPDGFPLECFMAAKLRDDAKPIMGAVMYAAEFGL